MLKAGLNKKNSINNSNYRKKLPSTSEIDISSHSSWQKKCENGTDRKFPCPYLWYGTMIIRRCQNGDEKLFKSVKNGKAHEPQNFAAGNFAMKKYRSACSTDVGSSSRKSDCYENRMFKYPYINQLTPLVPPPPPTPIDDSRNRTEYQDGISRTGLVITKLKLHDHSKCGKQGTKCEHKIPALKKALEN